MGANKQTMPRLEPARSFDLDKLLQVAEGAIVSRELVRNSGGTITLFGFDAGQEISEHTAPVKALVQVLEGQLRITIAAAELQLKAGQVVLIPANVPHALQAESPSRMLLMMLREPKAEGA